MDWFDPSDDVIIRPEIDREWFWAWKFNSRQIEIAPQVLFVNNGLGKLFDVVCAAMDEKASPVHDHRQNGYCHYQTGISRFVTVYQAWEPAPYAVRGLEHLISAGAKQIVFINGSGSLREDLPVGSILLPQALVREEGTSYHYVPGDVQLRTNEELNQRIRKAAAAINIPLVSGDHWTTDAIYRETWGKVERYYQRGINSVDMELSALAAAASYWRCDLSALLAVTDMCTRNHTWNDLDSVQFSTGVLKVAQVAVKIFMQ